MKGQRREPRVGDIFVMLTDAAEYVFGRIVRLSPERYPNESDPFDPMTQIFPGDVLVYMYRGTFTDPKPDLASMTPDRLLLPPFFALTKSWHRGYMNTVGHQDLKPADLLEQHCFWSGAQSVYRDDRYRLLDRRHEPCGRLSLPTQEAIEIDVVRALNGEFVPPPYLPGEQPSGA